MARHPWVAAADHGVRFGVQLVLRPESLATLPALGRRVEALGFDALFIFDHPVIHPDPWPCLAAVAATTERIRLGSMVNCVPYRHPLHLARLAADLDNLSGGRAIYGLGIGWLEDEFRALGVPLRSVGERHAELAEAIAIARKAWTGEPFSHQGERFPLDEVRIVPGAVQPSGPPVVIGGAGEKLTLRQVARWADACNITDFVPGQPLDALAGAETARHKLAVLRAHCEAEGRPHDEVLRTHFTLNLMLARTEEAATAKVAAFDPAGSLSPGTRRAGRAGLLGGTPEQLVAAYRARVEAGMQYFVVQLDAGDAETLELLATEVMPHVRR